MLVVAFAPPSKDNDVNHWAQVLTHFPPDDMFFLQDVKGLPSSYSWSCEGSDIVTADDLPSELPLVLCVPPNGRYIQGDIALSDFTHPPDAIYMFGHDHQNLDETWLGSRVPDYKVYVETGSHHEMYSHVAAAVILHDRARQLG